MILLKRQKLLNNRIQLENNKATQYLGGTGSSGCLVSKRNEMVSFGGGTNDTYTGHGVQTHK